MSEIKVKVKMKLIQNSFLVSASLLLTEAILFISISMTLPSSSSCGLISKLNLNYVKEPNGKSNNNNKKTSRTNDNDVDVDVDTDVNNVSKNKKNVFLLHHLIDASDVRKEEEDEEEDVVKSKSSTEQSNKLTTFVRRTVKSEQCKECPSIKNITNGKVKNVSVSFIIRDNSLMQPDKANSTQGFTWPIGPSKTPINPNNGGDSLNDKLLSGFESRDFTISPSNLQSMSNWMASVEIEEAQMYRPNGSYFSLEEDLLILNESFSVNFTHQGASFSNSTTHQDIDESTNFTVTQWPEKQFTITIHHPILAGVLGIMCFFVIFGNILVMVAIKRERALQSVTNYFVVSLAAADCLVGLVVMPFSVIHEVLNKKWIFNQDFCDLWHSFDVLGE